MKFFLPLITLMASLAAAAPTVDLESNNLEARLVCPSCDDLHVCTCSATLVSAVYLFLIYLLQINISVLIFTSFQCDCTPN